MPTEVKVEAEPLVTIKRPHGEEETKLMHARVLARAEMIFKRQLKNHKTVIQCPSRIFMYLNLNRVRKQSAVRF